MLVGLRVRAFGKLLVRASPVKRFNIGGLPLKVHVPI